MTITTPQLTIRRFTTTDLTAVNQMGTNPEITRQLNMSCFQSTTEARAFLQMLIGDTDAWALVAKADQRVCGLLMLAPQLAADQAAVAAYEMSFAILPAYQRRGLISEAIPAIIKAYQQTTGVQHYQAACFLDNVASQKTLEKAGFSADYQGQLPDFMGGQTIQYYRYLIV